ncbi:MAG: DUF3135 domain-containing protein [Gammaproteobacteria bacterium]|nr:DUF3135 domain-containing protein [Gammaproteobacteria bacterium]
MQHISQDGLTIFGEMMLTSENFDFDEWLKLAKNDVDAFEIKRDEYIKQFIAQAPEKYHKRMSGVQWRIDMERNLTDSSLASCLKIYGQMWDSLCGDDGLCEKMESFLLYVESADVFCDESLDRKNTCVTSNVVNYR